MSPSKRTIRNQMQSMKKVKEYRFEELGPKTPLRREIPMGPRSGFTASRRDATRVSRGRVGPEPPAVKRARIAEDQALVERERWERGFMLQHEARQRRSKKKGK